MKQNIFQINLFKHRLILYIFYIIFCLLLIFSYNDIYSYQASYFYRASYLPQEPRFQESKLLTSRIYLNGGDTINSYDSCGNKVPLFSLFSKDNNKYFTGTFKFFEARFIYTFNLYEHLFFEYTIPLTKFFIDPISSCNKKDFPYINCKEIYQGNNITPYSKFHTDISDCITLLGYALNYEDCQYLDYIDLTLKAGVLWPTGSALNINDNLSIPNGYNAWGIPLVANISCGMLDWFTMGLNVNGVILTKYASNYYSNNLQDNNMLRPKPGNVSNFSIYAKADHFVSDFSFTLGYTHSYKSLDTSLNTLNKCKLHNNNNRYNFYFNRPWRMDVINIVLGYEYASEDARFIPEIEIFFNQIINGKNVFDTDTTGGMLGLNIRLHY